MGDRKVTVVTFDVIIIHLTLHLGFTNRLWGRFASLKFFTSSDDHEDGGNKEQRSPGGENEASNRNTAFWPRPWEVRSFVNS